MTTDRRVAWSLAVAAALILARPGAARAGEESGLGLGARVGYGIPLGGAMAGVSLNDVVSGLAPFQLDGWWRFDPSWRLGLWARSGFTPVAGASCPAGASCSAQNLGLGAQVGYTFAGAPRPWIGAGLGWEWQTLTVTLAGNRNVLHLLGVEFLDLQGGVDWRLSRAFALGPFASLDLGRYVTASAGGVTASLSGALHAWLQVGVRGTFDL